LFLLHKKKFHLCFLFQIVLLSLVYSVDIELEKEFFVLGEDGIIITPQKESDKFSEVNLPWNDYYPALGRRELIIKAGPVQNAHKYKLKCTLTNESLPFFFDFTKNEIEVDFDNNGLAVVLLYEKGYLPEKHGTSPVISIKFEAIQKSDNRVILTFTENFNVRHNRNVILGEVLAGTAVWTYEPHTRVEIEGVFNDYGKTDSKAKEWPNYDEDTKQFASVTNPSILYDTAFASDSEKKFDYIEFLMNQVLFRKRSVIDDIANNRFVNDYVYTPEKGFYNNDFAKLVQEFRSEFKVPDVSVGGNSILGLLYEQYGLSRYEWDDKIIDKFILVGNEYRVDDFAINTSSLFSETGLYELYRNAVKPFVDSLILEAERYAGISGETTPTGNWVSRTGNAWVNSIDETLPHGTGMSYCYGGKNTVSDFNEYVSDCYPKEDYEIIADYDNGNIYTGINNNCNYGGDRYWPGLLRRELNQQGEYNSFRWDYWTGIDCAGLVQRANKTAVLQTKDLKLKSEITQLTGSANNNDHRGRVLSTAFGTKNQACSVSVYGASYDPVLEVVRKGDLIYYNGHIAIAYSNKVNYRRVTREKKACNYYLFKMIHAYGGDYYTYPWDTFVDENLRNEYVFSRKVIITYNNGIGSIKGFGRIALWD
jgi:hypothetical protein